MQRFYEEKTGTAAFVKVDFGFNANEMLLMVATADMEISFDGQTVHGKVISADGPVPFNNIKASKMWVRGNLGVMRIHAWV